MNLFSPYFLKSDLFKAHHSFVLWMSMSFPLIYSPNFGVSAACQVPDSRMGTPKILGHNPFPRGSVDCGAQAGKGKIPISYWNVTQTWMKNNGTEDTGLRDGACFRDHEMGENTAPLKRLLPNLFCPPNQNFHVISSSRPSSTKLTSIDDFCLCLHQVPWKLR